MLLLMFYCLLSPLCEADPVIHLRDQGGRRPFVHCLEWLQWAHVTAIRCCIKLPERLKCRKRILKRQLQVKAWCALFASSLISSGCARTKRPLEMNMSAAARLPCSLLAQSSLFSGGPLHAAGGHSSRWVSFHPLWRWVDLHKARFIAALQEYFQRALGSAGSLEASSTGGLLPQQEGKPHGL